MGLPERLKYAEMKARHQDVLRPWYKKPWGAIIVIALIFILIILTISSVYVVGRVQQILAGQTDALTADQLAQYLKTISGSGTNYKMGTTTPQATIVEFGDFACPYSKESYQVVNRMAARYKDKVKIVWRDYLRNQDSIDLAMAARCAGDQGKFWEMHDLLFANQDSLTTADANRISRLLSLAQSLQLNMTPFNTCLTSQKYLDQIKKDYDDGNTLQIIGTPTWFVNNITFAGSLTEDKFRELISGLVK
jgi:protein-disulfide isomerase